MLVPPVTALSGRMDWAEQRVHWGNSRKASWRRWSLSRALKDRGICSGGTGWEAMLMRKSSSVDHVSSRLPLQALLEPFQRGQHHHGSIDPNFCTHLWIPFLSPTCSSCQFLLLSLHMPAPACLALPWVPSTSCSQALAEIPLSCLASLLAS